MDQRIQTVPAANPVGSPVTRNSSGNFNCLKTPSDFYFRVGLYLLEGKKEMFYLMMHSTHFIYGYMASHIW